MRRTLVLAAVACALIVGCILNGEEPEWKPVEPERMSQTVVKQRHEAEGAKEVLFANLARTLQVSIREKGVENAIGVCRAEAPRIAAEIAKERDLKIGRTSFKLRNPENAPPAWAEPLIAKRVESPRFLQGPDGELAALFPIRLKASCMTCHGLEATVDPKIREKIAEAYPEDRAMGFSANELRGWFWIEVPRRN
jgi:hypothetical protein